MKSIIDILISKFQMGGEMDEDKRPLQGNPLFKGDTPEQIEIPLPREQETISTPEKVRQFLYAYIARLGGEEGAAWVLSLSDEEIMSVINKKPEHKPNSINVLPPPTPEAAKYGYDIPPAGEEETPMVEDATDSDNYVEEDFDPESFTVREFVRNVVHTFSPYLIKKDKEEAAVREPAPVADTPAVQPTKPEPEPKPGPEPEPKPEQDTAPPPVTDSDAMAEAIDAGEEVEVGEIKIEGIDVGTVVDEVLNAYTFRVPYVDGDDRPEGNILPDKPEEQIIEEVTKKAAGTVDFSGHKRVKEKASKKLKNPFATRMTNSVKELIRHADRLYRKADKGKVDMVGADEVDADILYSSIALINRLGNIKHKANNLAIVMAYQTSRPDEHYVVIDKREGVFYLFKGDELIETYNVTTGQREGDELTSIRMDKKKNLIGNRKTPAGIFMMTGKIKYSDLLGEYMPLMTENGTEIATAFHIGNTSMKRASNGCVRFACKSFEDLYDKFKKGILKKGVKVYILPEEGDNHFAIVGDQIVFRPVSSETPYSAWTFNVAQSYLPIEFEFNREAFEEVGEESWSEKIDNILVNNSKELENFEKYLRAIEVYKMPIMALTGIDDATYNKIAKAAVGVLYNESRFFDRNSFFLNIIKTFGKSAGLTHSAGDYRSEVFVKSAADTAQIAGGYLDALGTDTTVTSMVFDVAGDTLRKVGEKANHATVGPTQVNLNILEREGLKEQLSLFGINDYDDLLIPRNAAVLTVLRLAYLYRTIPRIRRAEDQVAELIAAWEGGTAQSRQVYVSTAYHGINSIGLKIKTKNVKYKIPRFSD